MKAAITPRSGTIIELRSPPNDQPIRALQTPFTPWRSILTLASVAAGCSPDFQEGEDTLSDIPVEIELVALTGAQAWPYADKMRAGRPILAGCRATIAVVALYALVLQALLGGMAMAAVFDPTKVICASTTSKDDGPSKPQPVHAHHLCCTVAHGLDASSPPLVPATIVAWPQRHVVIVAWRPEVVAAPRAPPGVSPSARAPPVV